jgi:pyridoxamine 5'-phosphate oxidase
VIDARRMLEAKFQEMLRKFKDGQVPLPSFWGGYRVTPKTIEFWQGGAHRCTIGFCTREPTADGPSHGLRRRVPGSQGPMVQRS